MKRNFILPFLGLGLQNSGNEDVVLNEKENIPENEPRRHKSKTLNSPRDDRSGKIAKPNIQENCKGMENEVIAMT